MRGIALRHAPREEDRAAVRRLVRDTGFFHSFEVDVAGELVDERLARGEASGYHFVFADGGAGLQGYACFGPIACTRGSFDLYWIAVDRETQGRGLGRRLLAEAEARVRAAGGRRLYVETSSRPLYDPTRAFYRACGYRQEARLEAFYAPDDDKLVLVKVLAPEG